MFADLELACRLERTEGSAGAAFVEARGGDAGWVEIAGVYAMFDGPESPLTQTFGLGMFEPATGSVLTQIEEYFQIRKAPVHHEVCPLSGVPLSQTLVARGYVPFELSNVLFMDLGEVPRKPVLNPALTIRIAHKHDADVYARTAAEGWQETAEVAHLIAELARVMFAAAGYTGFMVEKDGRAIATAGLVIHDRVALLAGASTIPEARGQGAQQAVLSARLRHAAHAGCDLAMMVAEPGSASQRNAERNGFRIAYTRTKWRLAKPA
jgi:GNAT superfamily N-acetyltransferase